MDSKKNISNFHVHNPKNLNALLAFYQKHPQAQIYGGGTSILLRESGPDGELSRDVISLGRIPDLNHVSRTESYLEIGAMTPISRVLGIGRHVLASSLYSALSQVGTPPVRNFATLGGNLAQKDRWISAVPPLLLLDVRLELRRHNNSEWLPMAKFLERNPLFREGELITRIRIPLEEWNVQHYRRYKADAFGPRNELSWCALADVQKGTINRFRMAVGAPDNLIIRNREMENTVEGKKLPLNNKDIQPLKEQLQQTLENVQPRLTPIQQQLMTRTTYWFMLRYLEDLWEEVS